MARMIPEVFFDLNDSHAEKRVFKALKNNLDEDWTVFHSYTMLGENHCQRLIDSEIDFLLFHPTKGLLVLEVKGGQISCSNQKWFQNGKQMKQSPANQAKHCKYNILDYLNKNIKGRLELPVAHAVCFPDCYGDLESLPPDTAKITINGDVLSFVEEEVNRILVDFSKGLHIKPSSANSEQALRLLSPNFEYGGTLSDQMGLANEAFFRMTEEQSQLLNFISGHKQALIEGCAGSGKTIMAIKKAKMLSESCESILFLCYNNMLCQKVKEELKGFSNIQVETYHSYCLQELLKDGFEFTPSKLPKNFWDDEIPSRFVDLLTKKQLHFDALIIDEGQDFREQYWISISELIDDNGYFYIFYDPDQNLYETKLQIPELGNPFLLTQNCRNCKFVFEFLKEHNNSAYHLHKEAPLGIEPKVYEIESSQLKQKNLSQLLSQLIDRDRIKPEQIVLLGGHAMKHTFLNQQTSIGKFKISENGDNPEAIAYYSLMKFKGCEAEVVILIDVDKSDKRWCNKNIYTAASRAKYALYIFKKGVK
jgi:hypothetical protein